MPAKYVPGSELPRLRKAAKRLGLTNDNLREHFGGGLSHLHQCNPDWPAFALIGLLIETAVDIAEDHAEEAAALPVKTQAAMLRRRLAGLPVSKIATEFGVHAGVVLNVLLPR
ncbi:hypothetical protein ACVFDQ_002758 [Enterobacter hormaechei]